MSYLLLSIMILSRSALSGGEGTVFDESRNAYSRSMRNISSTEHRRNFHVGNSFFNENWVRAPASTSERDGLGPFFNTVSCSSCHFKDGRGLPFADQGLLVRLSLSDQKPEPRYGDQLQTSALDGLQAEGSLEIEYEYISGSYADGSSFQLRKPKLIFSKLAYGDFHKDTRFSARIAASVFGLGLLEAIPEEDLLRNIDPHDEDWDGISGDVNWVMNAETGEKEVGRFGWKANQPSIRHQNASAFHGDLGLTSPVFPKENCLAHQDCQNIQSGGDPEISDQRLNQMTDYIRLLAVPAARDIDAPEVVKGERIFSEIGCINCHQAEWTTSKVAGFPELSDQTIYPFTDLLLHDMGPGLADNRPDGMANGQEWRTPPLWGLGLLETVNGHSFLLHDGRARNIEEAILWHGGEAFEAKENFRHLSKKDRDALIRFLKSL